MALNAARLGFYEGDNISYGSDTNKRMVINVIPNEKQSETPYK